MKIKLSRPVEDNGRRVRTVTIRSPGLADLALMREMHDRFAAEPERAAAEMIAAATGLSVEAVSALPLDDVASLMEGVATMTETATDRLVRMGMAPAPGHRRH